MKVSNMQVIPFDPQHVRLIEHIRNDKNSLRLLSNDVYIEALHAAGPAFSVFIDTPTSGWSLLTCAGVGVYWDGVAEVWLIASELVDKYKLSFHRVVKTGLNRIQNEYSLHRIQASVAEDDSRAVRWVEALGFDFEGELKAFGPNRENYLRYARVTSWLS